MSTVTARKSRGASVAPLEAPPRDRIAAAKPPLEQRAAGMAGRPVLPGDDLIGFEDRLEELVVRELVRDAAERGAGGQRRYGGAVERDDRHGVTLGELARDGGERQLDVAVLQEVEGPRHQKTRERRARRTSSVISSRPTRTTGWPSTFQSASAGTEPASTWKGTPSRLRFSRNFAMSSPSTRSSVSASSRWAAEPVSTKVTAFSPATMPTPIRMASNARPERRGSAEIRTRTGSSLTGWARSVQRDEAIGAVDEVGEHHQAAVRDAIGVVERDAPLLAAVRADEQLRAARGQRLDARILERAHAVVDEVEVDAGAARERGSGQTQRGLEVVGPLGA